MLLLLLAVLATGVLYHQLWGKRKFLPPGPMPIPLIGNYQLFHPDGPHVGINNLRQKYGPIFTIWIGTQPNVILCDFSLMKKYMTGRYAEAFSGRARNYLFDEFYGGKAHGILMIDGEKWREQRRFSLHVLRDFGVGRNVMESKINDEILTLIRHIDDALDNAEKVELDLEMPIQVFFGSIISNLVMGHRFGMNDERFRHIKETLDELFQLVQTPQALLIGQIPVLRHIPWFSKVWNRLMFQRDVFHGFLREEIAATKKRYDPEQQSDFTSAYLKVMIERREEMNEDSFNEHQLAMALGDLWVGGMETTVTTLRWGLMFMANRPCVQEKVAREILDYFKDDERSVTIGDRIQLPYTTATLIEIDRAANITPINTQHRLTQPVTIESGGKAYALPKDTIVIPQMASVHMDPRTFPQPREFRPERYLEKGCEGWRVKKAEQVIPFSMGKRVCLGESLARMELFMVFTSLLRRFRFGTQSPISETPVVGFTCVPQHHKLLIERR